MHIRLRNNFHTNLYQTCTPESTDLETHLDHGDLTTDVFMDDQDLHDLLQHKVASLLLRTQRVLHVSKATTQEIVN